MSDQKINKEAQSAIQYEFESSSSEWEVQEEIQKDCQGHSYKEHHWQEFIASAIAIELILLNFRSVGRDVAFELLTKYKELKRTSIGRLTAKDLPLVDICFDGGWIFQGQNILGEPGEISEWGIFKPDTPRDAGEWVDGEWVVKPGKKVKYESIRGVKSSIFACRIPKKIWKAICLMYHIEHEIDSDPWEALARNPQIRLCITEGAKKTACINSFGMLCIGLNGIWNFCHAKKDEYGDETGGHYLYPEIDKLITKDRQVYILFDQDQKLETQQNVKKALKRLAKLIRQKKAKLYVCSWNNAYKGIDDYLVSFDPDSRQTEFDKVINNALPIQAYLETQEKLLEQLWSVEKVSEQYISNVDIEKLALHKFLCLKSAKGTGKTVLIKKIAAYLKNIGAIEKVVLINHRTVLGASLAHDLEVYYVDDERASQSDFEKMGFAICIDSFSENEGKKIDDLSEYDFSHTLIIMDEIDQTIRHLLFSTTHVSKVRINVNITLAKAITKALEQGGHLIIADADLNPKPIKYIKNITKPFRNEAITPFILENEYNPNKENGRIALVYKDKTPELMLQDIKKDFLERQLPVLFVTDAQQALSNYGTISLEEWAIRNGIPPKLILRVDAETIKDKNHPAYNALYCNEYFSALCRHYLLVIISPVAETGISIDTVDHFSLVAGILNGVLTINSALQFLSRLRAHCPRYVWAAKRGLERIGYGETEKWNLKRNQKVMSVYTMNLFTKINKENPFGYEYELVNTDEELFKNAILDAYCDYGALTNSEQPFYRDVLYERLAAEGYDVMVANDTDKTEIFEKISERQFKLHKTEEKLCDLDKEIENLNRAAGQSLNPQEKDSVAPTEQEDENATDTPSPEIDELTPQEIEERLKQLMQEKENQTQIATQLNNELTPLLEEEEKIDLKIEEEKALRSETKLRKKGLFEQKHQLIAQQQPFSSHEEFQKAINKPQRTPEDKAKIEFHRMTNMWGFYDEKIAELDRKGQYNVFRRYFEFVHQDRSYVAKKIETKLYRYLVKNNEAQVEEMNQSLLDFCTTKKKLSQEMFIPDFNKSFDYAIKYIIFTELRIAELYDEQKTWTEKEALQWLEDLKKPFKVREKRTIKGEEKVVLVETNLAAICTQLTGINLFGQDTAIAKIQKLLKHLTGVKLKCKKKKDPSTKKTIRIYSGADITETLDKVFSHWHKQEEEKKAKQNKGENVS